jgi:Domain of unknown function (DUF6602)
VSGRRVQGRRSRSPCDGPQGRPRRGGREPDNGHRGRRPPRPGGFGLWEMLLAVGRRGRAGRASQGRARRGERRTRRRRRRLDGYAAEFGSAESLVGDHDSAPTVAVVTEERGLLHYAMEELSSALGAAVGASSLIQHRLLKGEFRERRVISGLRTCIPRRYEINSGVVINDSGASSQQQDVILSDSMVAPPFLAAGELSVFPIEAVSAVIEVKSVATSQAVKDAVANIASVKTLMPDIPRALARPGRGLVTVPVSTTLKPFGGILFLGRDISQETVCSAYLEACSGLAPINRPNALVVVNEMTVMWGTVPADLPAPRIHPDPSEGTHLLVHRSDKDALLSFYVNLMTMLREYSAPNLDLISYLNNGGGVESEDIAVRELPSSWAGAPNVCP